MTVYSPGRLSWIFPLLPPVFPYLVLHGALIQRVQFSAQLVYLVTDVIHFGTETLIAGQIRVKLLLILPALVV